LATALDLDALVQSAYLGHGQAFEGPLPPGLFKTTGLPAVPRKDPARAAEELRAVGAAGLQFTLLAAAGSRPAQVFQEQLRQAGVTVNIQTVDFGSQMAAGASGNFDAMTGSGGSLHGHVVSQIVRTFDLSPNNILNLGRYSSPQIDPL